MSDAPRPIHVDPIGHEAFQRLSDLIAERKETNAFAPVTVVVASQYADVILRRTPTVQNRTFLSALGEPDYGSFTDYA